MSQSTTPPIFRPFGILLSLIHPSNSVGEIATDAAASSRRSAKRGIDKVLGEAVPVMAAGGWWAFHHLQDGTYDLNMDTSVPQNPYTEPSVITPHNKLLTSVLHLMGRTDIQAVGDHGTNGEVGGADLDNAPLSELMS